MIAHMHWWRSEFCPCVQRHCTAQADTLDAADEIQGTLNPIQLASYSENHRQGVAYSLNGT